MKWHMDTKEMSKRTRSNYETLALPLPVAKALTTWCDLQGMSPNKTTVVGRLLVWFMAQPGEAQQRILRAVTDEQVKDHIKALRGLADSLESAPKLKRRRPFNFVDGSVKNGD